MGLLTGGGAQLLRRLPRLFHDVKAGADLIRHVAVPVFKADVDGALAVAEVDVIGRAEYGLLAPLQHIAVKIAQE